MLVRSIVEPRRAMPLFLHHILDSIFHDRKGEEQWIYLNFLWKEK
jgi:hypothetical protein